MSIEDIAYLKDNCLKQNYMFLVDSKDRDRKKFPYPSEYTIEFTTPFKYVFGIEIVDVSIPKTMYNIDINNNRLYYYIADNIDNNKVTIITQENNIKTYDISQFSYIDIEPGDYTSSSLIDQLNSKFYTEGIPLTISAISTPIDLTNKIYFSSTKPFILDMNNSTISEILGFDTYTTPKENNLYQYVNYNEIVGFEQLFHSMQKNDNYVIYAPGMVYLIGYKYLLIKCPEIEQHLYRSLAYSKYNLGLGKVRINSYGYNDEQLSFMKVPIREFHPIGKLNRISLRFETDTGELYDFKGVNHNLVFVIYYYEPRHTQKLEYSILNPEYKFNFIDYLYDEKEKEIESDEDNEEYSRDNINIYKLREREYSNDAIDNKNKMIAYKNILEKKKEDEIINKIKNKINLINKNNNDSDADSDSD